MFSLPYPNLLEHQGSPHCCNHSISLRRRKRTKICSVCQVTCLISLLPIRGWFQCCIVTSAESEIAGLLPEAWVHGRQESGGGWRLRGWLVLMSSPALLVRHRHGADYLQRWRQGRWWPSPGSHWPGTSSRWPTPTSAQTKDLSDDSSDTQTGNTVEDKNGSLFWNYGTYF